MSVNVSNLADYSFDDIMKTAMNAMVTGLLVQNITGSGKTITYGSVEAAQKAYDWAEMKKRAASGSGGGRIRLTAR